MKVIELTVCDGGERIDRYLAEQIPDLTRASIQKLCQDGEVSLNGRPVSKSYRVAEGDILSVRIPDPQPLEAAPQDIPLDIVYEDPDLVVVNKPKGIVVHPAAGNPDGTLVNALLYHCKGELSGIGGVVRPGIVHRIDKNTSGLLVIAKNDVAHLSLADQVKQHSFTRIYDAVVYGSFQDDQGTVDAPIGRHPTDRKKMCVTAKNSKDAITHFQVVDRFQGFTHIRCRLETGRTHQIRVHMAHIGHPVAGDDVYGPKKCITSLNGQCLNASVLGFVHPRSGEYLEFRTDLPPYFIDFLKTLRKL